MSLNLNIPTTFELPVTIKIPQADDIKVDFIAARKTIKEFEALRADAVENNTELTDIDFLSQLIVGWSLCDKDGKDIEIQSRQFARAIRARAVYQFGDCKSICRG